jgi:hypothetical protein
MGEAERELRDWKVRLALSVKILSNLGYGMIAGPIVQSMVSDAGVPPIAYALFVVGLWFLGFAIYIAPLAGASDV